MAQSAPPVTTLMTSEAPATPEPPPKRAWLDASDGVFHLRTAGDRILLVPSARVHIDTYGFAGPGVAHYQRGDGTGLKASMIFRRFILEMGGVIDHHWFFWIGGNFAPTRLDGSQNPASTASVYDGFLGYEFSRDLRILVGQYNLPFTMENVTSSRWMDFMERALSVRTLGAPTNKDLGVTLWGNTPKGMLEGQIGVFGGDGMNRFNVDNRVDGTARGVLRPLVDSKGAISRVHLGGSVRYGSRDPDYVRYDAPSLSTPGGFTFWSSSYGSGAKETRVIPSRSQLGIAAELYVPFERFDLKGEIIYLDEGRREALSSDRGATLRAGDFKGLGGYAQLSFWLAGTARISGHPAGHYGRVAPPRNAGANAPYGLQLVTRAEMLRLTYGGNSHKGPDTGSLSAKTSDIQVNAYQIALNYWATRHVRITGEYSLYQFPGSPPSSKGEVTNQAAAPGAKGHALDPDASLLHEFSVRLGLAI